MAEVHRRSRRQEDRTARTYNGSRNVMSGAGWMRKADVRSMQFMIENKFTDAQSYSLKLVELRDLAKKARLAGRVPLFQVDVDGHRYVIIPEEDFLDLLSEGAQDED